MSGEWEKIKFEGFDNATQPQKLHWESVRPVFALCHEFATLSVFKQQLKRLAYRVETAGPVVATATVATTMCVKAPYYRKDMLVRAKIQFEGFDNATQPQKPHWESVRPVFALCHLFSDERSQSSSRVRYIVIVSL